MSNVYRIPTLSPEEIRNISRSAVADVAAQRITSSANSVVKSGSTGAVLSQAQGREIFKDAFNKVRKG
ncbi:hypothetical protein H0248_00340 [Pectobacterium brasiliense]|uniref:hypothetical protein n=1 Tax=Pectobacterium brasiliense TaxID=180957 RepID=UPI0015DF985C|nr:hypothetical protein [Pectobacterium brasiliense]MBA0215835.1 hypothetical protein [Pectobacterium brasiliense]